jgi:transcriptional regulator with GAF, ATPase, and Fis domain
VVAIMNIWCHFSSGTNALLEKAVVAALTEAGLSVAALNENKTDGPGVLFFNELNQKLIELLRETSRNGLERVLAISSSSAALTGNAAWQLLRAGASDVFAWDHSSAPASEVAARFERWANVDSLLNSPVVKTNLVGESPIWKNVLRLIVEVARFSDAPILITGESGTGKELVARLIHTLDLRSQKRELVTVDCTTIVPELSGSEFFGHERGSYTGAVAERDGAFALANEGTIFLDEVGELSPRLQSELLRVVQEHTYKRVGSNKWQRTNFRLICATNRHLQEEEAQGSFRRDFYHRIASWTFKLPPLCERPGDIIPLARHFMKQLCSGQEPPHLDEPVREYLLNREYPGNVRELKQVVTRMINRHVGTGPITVGDILEDRPAAADDLKRWPDAPFEDAVRRALALGVGLKDIGSAAAETAIRIAVEEADGNLQHAARKLGVTDRALQMRRAVVRSGDKRMLTASSPNGDT